MKKLHLLLLSLLLTLLTSCGFHLRGDTPLAPALQTVYIKTKTPYSDFTENLEQYLKMSKVTVVNTPQLATTIIEILSETSSQQLLGVNNTQLTRQYNLILSINFQITDPKGMVLVPQQTVTETRTLAINANQILAGSNESTALLQDMRRAIVFDVMNVLSSKMVNFRLKNIGAPQ